MGFCHGPAVPRPPAAPSAAASEAEASRERCKGCPAEPEHVRTSQQALVCRVRVSPCTGASAQVKVSAHSVSCSVTEQLKPWLPCFDWPQTGKSAVCLKCQTDFSLLEPKSPLGRQHCSLPNSFDLLETSPELSALQMPDRDLSAHRQHSLVADFQEAPPDFSRSPERSALWKQGFTKIIVKGTALTSDFSTRDDFRRSRQTRK